jgi:ParB family transcriptional regulator, chromosome partitioning protein
MLYSNRKMDDLVPSINVRGLLQPIIVRAKEEHYQIVTGNRRYNVYTTLGWGKNVCHVVETKL